jgi:hypothetical protein
MTRPEVVALFGTIALLASSVAGYGMVHPMFGFQKQRLADASEEGLRRVRSGAIAVVVFVTGAGVLLGLFIPRSSR